MRNTFNNKLLIAIGICVIVLLINSCTISKRYHNNGFNIDFGLSRKPVESTKVKKIKHSSIDDTIALANFYTIQLDSSNTEFAISVEKQADKNKTAYKIKAEQNVTTVPGNDFDNDPYNNTKATEYGRSSSGMFAKGLKLLLISIVLGGLGYLLFMVTSCLTALVGGMFLITAATLGFYGFFMMLYGLFTL